MLLFSPPRCDLLLGNRLANHSALTTRFSIRSERSIPLPLSPRSPNHRASRPSLLRKQQQLSPASTPSIDMSFHPGSPLSPPPFSPTLGSIPEVFEYEPLEATSNPATPNETPETPEAFIPEPSTLAEPKLSRASVKKAIIQSPRKTVSALSVSKILRKVLEADRVRRRRVLRVYLKAIVFLKYLWRANERYGSVMLTSGMYLPR